MKAKKNFSKLLLLCFMLIQYGVLAQPSDTAKVSVERIILIGNKITRPQIVYRELIFHVGDTIPEYVLNHAMDRSRENLMNTSLFNFVTIDKLSDINNQKTIVITMTERWYIFPLPVIEFADRNFNEWLKTKDFSRIIYGFILTDNNFRGMKELFQLSAKFGYAQKVSFNYYMPYINKQQDNGLQLQGGYNRNHEITYNLEESKLLFYKNENSYVRKEYYGLARYIHRDGIYNYTGVYASYTYAEVADTVTILNPNYFVKGTTFEQYLSIGYKWTRDKRDYKVYFLKGYYFDAELTKNGIGILKNEPSLLYISSTFKKSIEFNKYWHYNFSIKGRITGQSDAPFYHQRALGYQNDYVRGYEYYVVNGQNFLLAKTNLKLTLLPQHVYKIPGIASEKFGTIPYAFYINAFCDLAYVEDNVFESTNPLSNQLLPGYGIGLDLVTYYNIVWRIEYSFNKFGEKGIFLHFTNSL